MSDLQELQGIRARLEELQRRGHRAEGALEQLQVRLKKEFDVGDLEAAKALLGEFEEDLRVSRRVLEKAYQDFIAKWGELLGEMR